MRKNKKLTLHRESIRLLNMTHMGQVAGGGSLFSDCLRCIVSDVQSCIPQCAETWSGCTSNCC